MHTYMHTFTLLCIHIKKYFISQVESAYEMFFFFYELHYILLTMKCEYMK